VGESSGISDVPLTRQGKGKVSKKKSIGKMTTEKKKNEHGKVLSKKPRARTESYFVQPPGVGKNRGA